MTLEFGDHLRKKSFAGAVLVGLGAGWLALAPATMAQTSSDDSRPGGVEHRPSAPKPPAAATMAPAPSMLYRAPAVTPPVLPTPVQAVPPPPAPTPPAVAPAAPAPAATPPTPPPAGAPAPATTAPAGKGADATKGTGKAWTADVKKSADANKGKTGEPATKKKTAPTTRSFRYESAPRAMERAPAAGSAAPSMDDTRSAPSPIKGDERRPGGVERAPGVE